MGLIRLFFENPLLFAIVSIPLLYSVIIHEVAHGLVAYWFGDNTAKYSGRLSLSPVSHIDPVGLLALLFVGFGWARPVPVNFLNLRNFRLGLVCVAMAGCFANIFIATVSLLLLQFPVFSSNPVAFSILYVLAQINIMLGAFNLIPIPPLDGSKILMGMLPRSGQVFLTTIEPFGFFILIALLMTHTLDPLIDFVKGIILLFIAGLLRLF